MGSYVEYVRQVCVYTCMRMCMRVNFCVCACVRACVCGVRRRVVMVGCEHELDVLCACCGSFRGYARERVSQCAKN